jgi:hypothetical protein
MRRLRPSFVLAALAVLVALSAAASRAETLAQRAAAIDAPGRGPAVTLAVPLAVGRGTIAPVPGTAVYDLLAGGAPCGLLVDGPARLTYRVEDRFSTPVAERNLRTGSSLSLVRANDELTVTVELSSAIVWGWGMSAAAPAAGAPAEASASGPAATPGAPATALPPWAAKVLADRRFAPPSHDLLAVEANGGRGLRYALLHGPRETLLLYVNPTSAEEGLYELDYSNDPAATFRGGLRPVQLAAQPIGRPWWERPLPQLFVEHEALRVENPSGDLVRLGSRSRLRAREGGVALWAARLADRVAGFDGRERVVTVKSVRVDGRTADFIHTDDELLVPLGRALDKGATAEVEVAYEGELAVRPSGNSYWALGTGPWYPRGELGGELATMEIDVDVPEGLTPFASGAEVARVSSGGRTRLSTRLDRPMQLAVVAAGKYGVSEETRDGVTCRVGTYALLKGNAARDMLNDFFAGRAFFEGLLEQPYPFRTVSIIELETWGFGQAPPGVIFFTKEFFNLPTGLRRNRMWFINLDSRLLHEIAHAWWGHVAKMESPEEAWVTEAFADYSAALALWRLRGGERGQRAFDDMVTQWTSAAADLGPGASLYLSSRLAFVDDRDGDDYWRLYYARGPLVVHAIRLELQRLAGNAEEGDRRFIAFLRAFLKRNREGYAPTRSLVATLDELTGKSWQPWFEKHVYGTETPPLPH